MIEHDFNRTIVLIEPSSNGSILFLACCKFLKRLPALLAAVLLPTAQPILFATVVSGSALLVSQAPAHAQSAEAIAKVAQAITVRIEGATQGSGVLVKREVNRYTVLTAWHVVSGQRPGEELDIYTPDGQRHQLEQGSIKRLGDVDMAVLTFPSTSSYELAKVGDVKSISSGEQVLVAGFPIDSNGRLKYDSGKLVANAAVGIDQGYQLLYTNDTIEGMSGGVVLKADGTLIGMHGRGELDELKSQQAGFQIKTGTNQGVPISYWKLYSEGLPVVAASTQASTADDYLAQARALAGKKGSEQEVIRLANQSLLIKQSAEAYFHRASAKNDLGDKQGAIADLSQAIAINPKVANAYSNRGYVKSALGDNRGAIADYNQAIAINPKYADCFYNRANAKSALGDKQGAIADWSQAIAINPQDADAYMNRGIAKFALGDKQGAIADMSQAIVINPQESIHYYNRGNAKAALGDKQGAIADWSQAIAINPQYADAYMNRGNAKAALGDKQGAIADYNQAIAINPQESIHYYNRGIAKSLFGDRYGACEDMRKSASLGFATAQRFLLQVCQ